MTRNPSLLLAFILLLAACKPTSQPTPTKVESATRQPTATTELPSATPVPTVTFTPTPNRTGSITEIENTVEARASAADEYAPATTGQILSTGGALRTGEDGRVRLDLKPDNTIIRVAPNTIFSIPGLEELENEPLTLLELFIGKLYIILTGGDLQVKTPSGVAAVRGSMLGVSYDPKTGKMTATCLEGHCSLKSRTTQIDLIGGQAADILDGRLSDQPRSISDGELFDWLDYAPELNDLIDKLPDLPDLFNRIPRVPKIPRLP